MSYNLYKHVCFYRRSRRKQRLSPITVPEDVTRKIRKDHSGSFLFVKKSERPPDDPKLLKDAPHIVKIMEEATVGRGYSKRGLWCLKNNYSYLRNHFYASSKGVRSVYFLRLLEYSAGKTADDKKAMSKIKKFFRVIHKRQRYGYKMSYGIGALLRQPNYKVTKKETRRDPGEFKFWIPIRQNCIGGNDPISISSNAQFQMFLDSLDYTKIKDNTDTSISISSTSAWRLCYTTNLVVFVFHNKRRTLKGHGRKKTSYPRSEFLINEAEVIIVVLC